MSQYGPLSSQPDLSLSQILEEAQHRWLRPIEVCGILMNYRRFKLEQEPTPKPQSGSTFLFDRKAVRYFRKDGHNWRKKKDGKTVREAHERLKAGSKEVLHCYYAHGEDNENFQRRSYWMLERDLEHIVLVHYREVKEGNKIRILHPSNDHVRGSASQSQETIPSVPQLSASVSPEVFNQASSPSASEHSLPLFSPQHDGYESSDDPEQCMLSDLELPGGLYQEGIAKGTNSSLSRRYESNARTDLTNPSFGCAQNTKFQEGRLNSQMTKGLFSMPESKSIALNEAFKEEHHHQQPFSSLSENSHSVKWMDHLERVRSEAPGSSMGFQKQEILSTTWTCMPDEKSSLQDRSPLEFVADSRTHLAEHLGTTQQFMRSFGAEKATLTQPFVDLQDEGSSYIQTWRPYIKKGREQYPKDSPGQSFVEHFGDDASDQRQLIWTQSKDPNLQKDQMQQLDIEQKQKQELLLLNELSRLNASTSKNISHSLYSQIFRDFQDDSHLQQEEQEHLKKIDSFGRWITQEIGAGEESPLLGVSLSSTTHWAGASDGKPVKQEVSQGMQLGVGLSLSLSREPCFSFVDFAPDHAVATEETKVLITGVLLDSARDFTGCKWSCMFGNVEVPAELICPGVLRTKAPSHAPGRVPFFITQGDGVACSEVREFYYHAGSKAHAKDSTLGEDPVLQQNEQDMLLQIRFSRLLSSISQIHLSEVPPGKRDTPTTSTDNEWAQLEHALVHGNHLLLTVKEHLVQKLLKEKLQELQKSNALEKGESTLDSHGLGVLHMGAALGYHWVIGPLSSGGLNINFRDARGWTALHWAAYCGRERTVVVLLAAGADPGAKTDPTPNFLAGQTPADLASSCGHKGIAGYLAESSLTSHLSSLTLQDCKMGKFSAPTADRKAVETVSERTSIKLGLFGSEGQISMQDSLAAMRNATQAAARIHVALQALSFHRRHEGKKVEEDEYGISDDQLRCMLSAKKPPKPTQSVREEDMQSAAIRIQQKYRGWKGRKDFLLFRQRVVKIQAHVRGHQVRQQHKKITWSVGILEKAILRWRRKGKGLRGFHKRIPSSDENCALDSDGDDDFLKAGRKQIEAGLEKALARVQSMVRSPEAREQYRRLLNGFQMAKAHLDGGHLCEDSSCSKETLIDEDDSSVPMTDM